MLFDTITLAEGGEISNLTVGSGTAFPANANVGEAFYRTDLSALYVYTGTSWITTNNLVYDFAVSIEGTSIVAGNSYTSSGLYLTVPRDWTV